MYIENCLQILCQSPFFYSKWRDVLQKNNGHQIFVSKPEVSK